MTNTSAYRPVEQHVGCPTCARAPYVLRTIEGERAGHYKDRDVAASFARRLGLTDFQVIEPRTRRLWDVWALCRGCGEITDGHLTASCPEVHTPKDNRKDMTEILKLKPHPAAQLFPMMSDLEIDELARDIKSHGQQSPVVTFQGTILDGRNRFEACRRAGIEPKLAEWFPRGGSQSPTQWVLSENLHRRHLTVDQRALIALDALDLMAKEAKARQRAAGGDRSAKKPWAKHTEELEQLALDRGLGELVQQMQSVDPQVRHEAFDRAWLRWFSELTPSTSAARLPPRGGKRSPTAAAQAAQATGVSARSVERARRVQQAKPEVLERVRAGELTLKQAEKVVVKETRLKEVLAYQPPKGRYAVIVADPPWRYDDTLDGSDLARGGLEYPTMSVDEICAMKVGENLGTPNCVLWLWTTNAFLLDGAAARVVREWGFTAKALLTWRKDRIGAGRYLRNQTEHVILAIKGSPVLNGESTPNVFDAPRRGHSEKPEKAFEIFERVSPAGAGARLELFAREPRQGWITSGSELTADGAAKKPAGRTGPFQAFDAEGAPIGPKHPDRNAAVAHARRAGYRTFTVQWANGETSDVVAGPRVGGDLSKPAPKKKASTKRRGTRR